MKQQYKRGENLNEEQVNQIIGEGYILHSVSVIPAHSIFSFSLVYHFVKDPYMACNDDGLISIEEATNKLMLDINGNDFLDDNIN